MLAGGDGCNAVDDAGVGIADEVRGNNLWGGNVGNLLAQVGVQRDIAQEVVDLITLYFLGQLEVEHSHGHVRGRNADGVAGELALKFRQSLSNSLGCAGGGKHHVQACGAAAAIALVVVIDEVLVIGEGVRGLHVAVGYTVAVIDDLKNRGNAVGGAGCSGENLIFIADVVVVDAVDDVLDIALARCGQQHAGDALGLEVLRQALAVAPCAGVVHQDGVVDAIRGVVDLGGIVGVDHLDLGAVSPDNLVFLVYRDGAVESTVDGIAAQQGSALEDVTVALLAQDNATQANATVSCLAGDEQAGQQASDAAEAVEDDVGGL